MRDYEQWHQQYDDPDSEMSWRLGVVRRYLGLAFDELPGELKVLSLCSGDGRDVIGVLSGRGDAERVAVTLVEFHPGIAGEARRSATAAGLDRVEVRTADAGAPASYADATPADVVLLVGILGNVSDADIWTTVASSPQICRPGAKLLWSRGLDGRDLNDGIRRRFAEAGFTELDYATGNGVSGPALGLMRYDGPPIELDADRRWFTFVN